MVKTEEFSCVLHMRYPRVQEPQFRSRKRSLIDLFTWKVYHARDMIYRVELSNQARKQLQKVPRYIVENLAAWVDDVEDRGLEEVRKISGYHDEPLHGNRLGQRSIRLSKSYRAIYRICKDDSIEFVAVEEISKHAY